MISYSTEEATLVLSSSLSQEVEDSIPSNSATGLGDV
jgi:hypothetical protein